MALSSFFHQLAQAVQSERSEDIRREQRCDTFLERVIRYQRGKGEVPTEDEFLQFREDLIHVAAVRDLQAGAPKSAPPGKAVSGAKSN